MMRCARAALLVAGLLAATACATPGPSVTATGAMWGFFSDSDVMLGPRALIATSSQVACETERRRRIDASSPCAQVVLSPGTGYFAIALPSNVDDALPGGATFATIDRDRCERLRTDLFRAYRAMGDCEPVSVRRAP